MYDTRWSTAPLRRPRARLVPATETQLFAENMGTTPNTATTDPTTARHVTLSPLIRYPSGENRSDRRRVAWKTPPATRPETARSSPTRREKRRERHARRHLSPLARRELGEKSSRVGCVSDGGRRRRAFDSPRRRSSAERGAERERAAALPKRTRLISHVFNAPPCCFVSTVPHVSNATLSAAATYPMTIRSPPEEKTTGFASVSAASSRTRGPRRGHVVRARVGHLEEDVVRDRTVDVSVLPRVVFRWTSFVVFGLLERHGEDAAQGDDHAECDGDGDALEQHESRHGERDERFEYVDEDDAPRAEHLERVEPQVIADDDADESGDDEPRDRLGRRGREPSRAARRRPTTTNPNEPNVHLTRLRV